MNPRLLRIIRDATIELDHPIFLSSGAESKHFVGPITYGPDLRLVCDEIRAKATGYWWDTVGGLTMGADGLAAGIAILAETGSFSVRKQVKDYGHGGIIRGAIRPGVRVLLVDDVVTAGRSIQQAFHTVTGCGGVVVAATCIVDRGEVAGRFFRNRAIPWLPLATYADLGIPPVG